MFKQRLLGALAAFGFLVLGGWENVGRAQEGTGTPAMALAKRLVGEGWERSPKNRGEAQAWFDGAPADIRANPNVRWAFALNRMHHRRYRDAKPLVDELAEQQPTNWDFAYARIWLATFVDEFEQSIALMQQLKKTIDAAADVSQSQKTEVYFRLGRMVGYMQGPNGHRVNRQSLENATAALLDGAGEEATRVFTQQRDAVIDQYASLMSTRDQKKEKEMETLVRKQQLELEQQTALVDQMKQQSSEARANRDRAISEGKAEVDQAKQQLDSLSAEWNRQQSIITSVRLDLEGLWITIAQIDEALLTETDPVIRQQLLVDRNYFSLLARDKELTLANLRAGARGLYNQLGSASVNYDQSVVRAQGRVNEIDQTIASAESTLNKANRRIRGLQGEPKVSSNLVGTIDATAAALTNYDPFPTDLLKQRLLDTLTTAK